MLLLLLACSTMTGARPLSPGEHAVGVTALGGMVDLGAPIPLPNLVLEGRSGVTELAERPLDVNYGLNATGLAFGIVQVHAGTSYLLLDQAGARPALSATNRLFLATNAAGLPYKHEPQVQLWGMDQVELTASWMLRDQLLYLAMAEYIDFRNPTLTPTPAAGAVLGRGGPWAFQVEGRWYGVNQENTLTTVRWVPGNSGVLGVTVGVSRRLAK